MSNNVRNRRNRNRRVQNKRPSNRRNNQSRNVTSFGLPKVNNKPIQTRCLRYFAASVTITNEPITVLDIRNAIGFINSGATTYFPIIDSVRLRRVGVSVLLSGTTGGVALEFSWAGTNVPDTQETMFAGIGIPSHFSFYPPPDSSSTWWYDDTSTNTNLFVINQTSESSGTADVYLDLEIEYILNDGAITSSLTLSGAAAFSGLASVMLPIASTAHWTALGLSSVNHT